MRKSLRRLWACAVPSCEEYNLKIVSWNFLVFFNQDTKMEESGAGPNLLEVLPVELLWFIFHFVEPKNILASATVRNYPLFLKQSKTEDYLQLVEGQ